MNKLYLNKQTKKKGEIMTSMQLIGLNTKWFRYQKNGLKKFLLKKVALKWHTFLQ